MSNVGTAFLGFPSLLNTFHIGGHLVFGNNDFCLRCFFYVPRGYEYDL